MHDLDRRIIDHARDRHGLITTHEAVALGATRRMLRTRVERGLLVPAEREVLQVAGAPTTWESRLLAAVLAAGPGAAASHRAAGALWELEGVGQGVPEITVPRNRRHKRAGVRVHQSTDLDRCGIRMRRGVPVTDPARTLLDLARRTGEVRLLQAIESARRQGHTTWSGLIHTLASHARRGRPGIQRLRGLIAAHAHRSEIADSDFELMVLVLLVEHGLPEPVVHHVLRSPTGEHLAEIDLAYPDLQIAIELDGAVHREKEVFERDRPRQNRIALQGWVILRFTWDTFVRQPQLIVAEVAAAIRLARGSL